MGRASAAMERLRRGEVVTLRPRGHSMAGRVNDGDVIVEPLGARALRGRECLHLNKAIPLDRCLIGNHRGGANGRVGRRAVAGVAVAPARR